MGWSIKKPFGNSGGSIVGTGLGAVAGGLIGGPAGAAIGASIGGGLGSSFNKTPKAPGLPDNSAAMNALAEQEAAKQQALAQQQQQQINDFATQQQKSVADYRGTLAQNLSNTAQQTFQQENPFIMEDLNSRGLFTSQTARDQSQNQALQQLATQQQNTLSNYDTQQFNNIQDIKGSGLSALLGGNQQALDTALQLREAGIQNTFNQQNQQAQMSYAQMLAGQQSRNQMISSVLGLGGTLGAASMMSPSTGTPSTGYSATPPAYGNMYSQNPLLNLYQPSQQGLGWSFQ